MTMAYYLRTGDDSIEDAVRHRTLADAKATFLETARELDRYGQRIEASVHIAETESHVQEYPDYVLALGPRGGLKCERA